MNIEVPGWEPHQGSDPGALSPSSGDFYGKATPIQKTLPESRRACQNATWLAVSTGRPRSSSKARTMPIARRPFPPMNTA